MTFHPTRSPSGRDLVIAVHCSGGSPRQWDWLASHLDGARTVLEAPHLLPLPAAAAGKPDRPHSLADEAAPLVERLRRHGRPAHLAGHSYGGAVVLHVALRHPELVASLCLYEPAAFHLLPHLGAQGRRALFELILLGERIDTALSMGESAEAARLFVAYWGGPGAWETLSGRAREAVCAYLPRARPEFSAMRGEEGGLERYRALRAPALLVSGGEGTNPARLVAEAIGLAMPQARLLRIAGAGHMGPLTHGEPVARAFAAHIGGAQDASRQRSVAAIRPAGAA